MGSIISLKKAELSDSKYFFDLANDPVVRSNSFNSLEIKWENHQKWFETQIQSKNTLLWIALLFGHEKIGVVRINKIDGKWIIGISLAKEARGKGYATEILKEAVKISKNNIKELYAYIKLDNIASLKTFTKAGFIEIDTKEIQGSQSKVLIWR